MVRRAWLGLLGLVVVALAIGGWSSYRALQAKDDLTQAQSMTTRLQSDLTEGRADAAVAGLPPLRKVLDRAESRTGGVAWSIAQHFPVFGRNLGAVRRTTLAAQILGDQALPEATQALDLVRTKQPLHNGRVDLAVLAQLSAHLDKASAASAKARELLAPEHKPLLRIIETKVAEAQARVADLDDALQAAARALDVAPTMLGRDGVRRYFVAVQNNAESRATGGLVGAYAVLKIDHGAVTLERHGPDTDFGDPLSSPLPSDPQAAKTWIQNGSTQAWFAANLTPHFPDAARNMAQLWTHLTGQKLDGVMGIDPLVMSDLMADSGPVALPDGSKVDAGSIVDFVMRDEYVRYPAGPPRKLILSALAADVFDEVIKTPDAVATLKAFGKAGGSGHLMVWSAHPEEQKRLSGGLTSGVLPTTDSPYLSVLTQNFDGNKLDYYLRRTVAVTRRKDGSVQLTLTLRNTAPTGLPDYVTTRSDHPKPPVPYGQSRIGVSIYGALSSTFGLATLDGQPVTPAFDLDHGHRFGTVQVELPRDKDVVLTFVVSEPAGELAIRQQPLVTTDAYKVDVPHRILGR